MAEIAGQTGFEVRLEAVADRLSPEKMAEAYRLLVPSVRMISADPTTLSSHEPVDRHLGCVNK